MWLSLLLSAGAEAASLAERKAGLRELAQRLGVASVRVSPGLVGRVEAWLASHPEAPDRARAVLREPRVGLLLEGLFAHLEGTDVEEPDEETAWMHAEDVTDEEGMQVAFQTEKDGLPVVHIHDPDFGWVVRPATIPTKLDATIGWWLEQVFRLDRDTDAPTLWSKLDEAGLLDSNATGRVQDWVSMTHPNLTRYTWATAKAASDAWHRRLGGSEGYGKPITGGDTRLLATWPDGATLVQLISKRDFAAEGTSMGHCVGGNHEVDEPAPGNGHYWQGHRDGRFAILSYRNPAGRPLLTLNLERSGRFVEVEQAQGPMDETPPVEATFRVLPYLVTFLRSIGAPEELVEKGIAVLLRAPVEGLFLSEEGKAILLASEDPFGIESLEELSSVVQKKDPDEVAREVRLLQASIKNSVGQGVPGIDLAMVRTVSGGLLQGHESTRIFSFGPRFSLSFGIGSGEEMHPYWVSFDLEVSEMEGGQVYGTWSVYQRNETFDDLEALEVPSTVDRNPFPFLEEEGLLFDVDRLLAWLRPRMEYHDAEAFEATVVAPPLLRGALIVRRGGYN
jgi:hypothetical protein